MDAQPCWLFLGILATWRVTHLLHAEDGPWDVLAGLRRVVGSGLAGHLLDCFYCLSVWVAVPCAFALAEGWTARLVLWPALSGGAILLERLTSPRQQPRAAPYSEDPGE